MITLKRLLPSLLATLIEGCAGSYGCKGFPQLPVCRSAVEAYHATDGAPLGKEAEKAPAKTPPSAPRLDTNDDAIAAVRADASILRIWMAPYEDEEGDLQSTRYVFTELEPRRWTLGTGSKKQTIRLTPLQVSQRGSSEDQASSQTSRSGRLLEEGSHRPRQPVEGSEDESS